MKPNYPLIRAVSVTTTNTLVLNNNPKRKAVLIYNNGTATVYLNSSIEGTTSTGIPIPIGTAYDNDHFNPTGEYYLVGTGTDDIRIEEDISKED